MAQAGATEEASFTIDPKGMMVWDSGVWGWVGVEGKFDVMVGSSSRDIRLEAGFAL